MKKKLQIFLTFILLSHFNSFSIANTTRDIGAEPDLDLRLIEKWIIFYTNIERIKNNIMPIQYDPALAEAASWQAVYCSKIQTLDHNSTKEGMNTPPDRIEHFKSSCVGCTENLTVNFSMNSEGKRFKILKDSDGIYYDYMDHQVYWRNEQQVAYSMVNSWMKSPGHRKNIFNRYSLRIGAGTSKGTYNKTSSYYGCQVFNGAGSSSQNGFTLNHEASRISINKTIKAENKVYTVSYNGELAAGIILVNEDKELISYPVEKLEGGFEFIRQNNNAGLYFVSLYDKQNNILYPMLLLE